jgi:dTDP-4-amino-4,6-dideoxygalactose transaminase
MTTKTEILELVEKYYKETINRTFIAGETYIPAMKAYYDENEIKSLVSASLDMRWVDGEITRRFEREMAKYLGVRFAIMCNSGSSANLLAVSALTSELFKSNRLKPGDEVVTVSAGFPTTVNPIIQNGLIPVFVDINIGTYNVSPYLVDQAITDKTRAIFIAHTLGNPYDIDEIKEIAKLHNLWVIEDCADCIGAEFDGKKLGTFGNVSTTSFYPAHIMSVGEGGMVFTDSPMIAKAVRSFRDWGRECFPAGTLVNVEGEQVPIEKVKVGDFVLSHLGDYCSVYETLNREYSGKLYTIKPRNGKEITCTENHPFWAKRDGKYGWIAAKELAKNDILLESLPAVVTRKNAVLSYSYKTAYKEVREKIEVTPELMKLIGYWLAEGSTTSGLKGKSGYSENKYLAYRVEFSFHVDEVEYIQEVKSLMGEVFGVSASVRKSNGNGITIQCKSRKAYEFFSQFFGTGASKKRIPDMLTRLPVELSAPLILGYWSGDGSGSKIGYSFCSTSSSLLNQIRRMLARLGIMSSYSEVSPEKKHPSVVNGKTIQAKHTQYWINIYGESATTFSNLFGLDLYKLSGTKSSYSYVEDGYICYPIESIASKYVSEFTVYNLEVREHESYHANNLAVHNCWCAPGHDNTCGKRFGQVDKGDLPDGFDHKYIFSHIGYNLKSTDLQASIGLEQLKKLPEFLEDRRENWEYLRGRFKELGLDKYFVLPIQLQRAKPAWFGFILTIREGVGFTRREIVSYLEENKIGSRNLFGGNLTKQPAYIGLNWRISDTVSGMPHTDIVMERTFWIGCHPSMSRSMLDYIIDKFVEFVGKNEKTKN